MRCTPVEFIRIYSPDFTLLTELDLFNSFSFTRSYFSVGEFELQVNRNIPSAALCEVGNLVICNDFSGIITYRERNAGERSEDDTQIVKGMSLSGLLGRRITVPPAGEAYDVLRTDAESVMRALVEHNCIMTGVARVIPNLLLGINQHRGGVIHWQSRYMPLADELEQIALASGLGWEIVPDFDNGNYVFQVYEGRDLTVDQDANNPVIFSPEFENIRTQRTVDSNSGYRSTAIVAGQGEGEERQIAIVGGSASGLDRFEVFIDARDIANDAELPERGRQKLSEYSMILTVEAEVARLGPFLYQQDWDLGDIVTVQNLDWGLRMNTRITEIQEVIEPQNRNLAVNFGTMLPTFMDRIKKSLSQTAQEVTR